MNRLNLISETFIGLCFMFVMSLVYAQQIPIWIFVPLTPTTLTIGLTNNALIQYQVINQSHKSHTLIMENPVSGITSSGCTSVLEYRQSCTLSLYITGSVLQDNVVGGPKLCQANSNRGSNLNQCYQPSLKDELHITLSKTKYIVTPHGDSHEIITPDTPQTVIYGAAQAFTVTANTGYTLSNVVGGTCPLGSWSGNTYTTGPITNNCSVNFSAAINIYTIGGSISGLTASGLVLQNNGGDNLSVTSGTSLFQFSTLVSFGSSYNVTVLQQPPGLTCTVSNGSGANVMADVNNVLVNCNESFAYVTTGFIDHQVYQCSLNPDGSFNTCNPTPSSGAPAWDPIGVTMATFNGVLYAYVGDVDDSGGGLGGHVYQCSLNPDGSFNVCTPTPSSGAPLWGPSVITFATFNGAKYAYVGTRRNVYQCSVNPDGSFNTCTPTPSSGAPSWQHPISVTFATVDGTQYAYVGDPDGGNVYQCSLNLDGSFNVCTPTPSSGAPLWGPPSVTFAVFSGAQYAYVADADSGVVGNVYQCTLNLDGSFSACNSTPSNGAPLWAPILVTFAAFSGVPYAYVTDINGIAYQCNLNQDGTLGTCNPTPSSGAPWNAVFWITFS